MRRLSNLFLFGYKSVKSSSPTCGDDHVGTDLLQPLLRRLRPVYFLHADGRLRPLCQSVQPDVVPQPPQDARVTVAEDVSARAAGATQGHAGQAHAAAQLQNRPAHTKWV